MSKAISSITKPIAKVVGGAVGSVSSGIGEATGAGTPAFKGDTREIDKDAFNVSTVERNKARARSDAASDQRREVMKTRQDLTQQLAAQARGETPSLAEAQMRAAQDRNLAQQLAAVQAQRGGNVAATQRQLLQNQQAAARQVSQDAAQARLQERQQAQQMLGQVTQADQQQLAQLEQNYLQLGLTAEQARQAALADYEKLQTNQFLSAQGLTAASFEGAAGRQAGITGGLLSGASSAGAAFAASDKNAKVNIEKVDSESSFAQALSDKNKKKDIKKAVKEDFLDKLTAYTYNYKDPEQPGAGKGKFVSVMAQDLEKAGPIGKSMVKDVNGTKMVDYGKGFGAILAAQAQLNERLNQLESKKKK